MFSNEFFDIPPFHFHFKDRFLPKAYEETRTLQQASEIKYITRDEKSAKPPL
jgi:hypothetical protein